MSKLPEKVVHSQVYSYFKENNLFHPNHHGFLPHHSTASALQQIIDFWLQSANKGKVSAALMLDLSAGFDVININILLRKLKIYKFDCLHPRSLILCEQPINQLKITEMKKGLIFVVEFLTLIPMAQFPTYSLWGVVVMSLLVMMCSNFLNLFLRKSHSSVAKLWFANL